VSWSDVAASFECAAVAAVGETLVRQAELAQRAFKIRLCGDEQIHEVAAANATAAAVATDSSIPSMVQEKALNSQILKQGRRRASSERSSANTSQHTTKATVKLVI
jgi:hypothetical protein